MVNLFTREEDFSVAVVLGEQEARQCPWRHLYPEPKNRDILKQMNSRNIMGVRDESRKNS